MVATSSLLSTQSGTSATIANLGEIGTIIMSSKLSGTSKSADAERAMPYCIDLFASMKVLS